VIVAKTFRYIEKSNIFPISRKFCFMACIINLILRVLRICSFICQGSLTSRQRSDLCGHRV